VYGTRSMDEALRAGADGYLVKPITPDQCVAALKFAMARQRKRRVAQRQNSGAAGAIGFAKLTQREKEIMSLLARGLLYKEIADELGISYSAVHKHQHNIFKKLGVNNRSEAARRWFEAGGG